MSTSRRWRNGKLAIIRRNLGSKLIRMEFASPEEKAASGKSRQDRGHRPRAAQPLFAGNDAEVTELAKYALIIEQHYGRAMDIEWGRDGMRRQDLHPAGPPGDGEEPGRGPGRAPLQAQGPQRRAGRGPRHRPEDRHRPGAPGGQRGRDGPRPARRCAGDRHDRPELGAGHEARRCHRHQPRRPHLPRGHHRPRAGHPGRGRLRRCHRDAQGRPAGHRGLLGGRHRLHLRRPARDRSQRGACAASCRTARSRS